MTDRDFWETLQWLVDELNTQYGFNLDLTCTIDNCKVVVMLIVLDNITNKRKDFPFKESDLLEGLSDHEI